jgi:hypothetical protein
MTDRNTGEEKPENPGQPPGLDRTVLLVFVGLLGVLFLWLNRIADGFMPDARLYPFVMTLVGGMLAAVAFIRVYQGKEPILDASSGKQADDRQDMQIYRQAVAYLLYFTAFYLGIWLLGFRVASVLSVFGFMRYFGQSNVMAGVYALAGLALVETLSRLLQLVLPSGFWHLLGLG